MPALSFRAYRTALALNNMAVTLMERGRYGPALKTMCDCLEMLKVTYDVTGSGQNTLGFMADMFAHAMQRYAKALKSLSSSCSSGRRTPLVVEAQPVDDEDIPLLRSAVKYGPSSSLVFPIRIFESPSGASNQEETPSAEMKRQFGIMLYNHGLAHLLVAQQQQHFQMLPSKIPSNGGGTCRKYLHRAHKSLQMAKTTLLSLVEQDEDSGNHAAEFTSLLLSALVLNSMSVVFHCQDLAGKAEEALNVVALLCSSFDSDCFTSILVQRHVAAAA